MARHLLPQLPGNNQCSIASIAIAASVVISVTINPTRANSQNVIFTFLAACCSTIKFATELNGVALPASVLVEATANHM